jgi:myo-inositol-1(or 4)-monophosphatase
MSAEHERRHRIEVAVGWAEKAGKLLLQMQEHVGGVESKGAVDFVSDADRGAQREILGGIQELGLQDGYLFEEDDCQESGVSGYTWVVDPLDGTTNYLHGSRHYAVSIGLLEHGARVGGVIYAPAHGELFVGVRGDGVRLNGDLVRVSTRSTLSESLLATGFPYDRRERLDLLLGELRRGLLHSRGLRRAGAAALDFAYVACGRLDGFWEHGLSPWDVCAGLLLVEEAGGVVSNLDGKEPGIYEGPFISSNGLIHSDLLKKVVRDQGED